MASFSGPLWRRILLVSAIGLSGPAMAQAGGNPPTANYLKTGQVVIVVTGTAVQFTKNAGLTNGVLVCAFGGWSSSSSPAQHVNTNDVSVGSSSVGNACDGSGTGDCIAPGSCHGYGVNDSSLLWLNGVAGDGVSFSGN